jgi:hypothetical protein
MKDTEIGCGCVDSIDYDEKTGKAVSVTVHWEGDDSTDIIDNPGPGLVKAAERAQDGCRQICVNTDKDGKKSWKVGRKYKKCCEELV